ncbi:hypothetical protein B0H15DRAFT_797967 [Mycena belliarum]|uniref:Uncharacterized protein n=1 Tax=Mycena belliarum TaxID=1033014 RepID=A0AAD6UAT7_9AGAR|nr:hypothetical protein B0H15DRAFT_797967 [Mycena belliae]
MPPTRTTTRNVRRASSPFLPSSILPSVRSRQAARNAELDTIDEVRHWLYTTQEETRAAKNTEIALLIKSVALDETKAMAARWAKEDYEESYSVFVPDANYPAWLIVPVWVMNIEIFGNVSATQDIKVEDLVKVNGGQGCIIENPNHRIWGGTRELEALRRTVPSAATVAKGIFEMWDDLTETGW